MKFIFVLFLSISIVNAFIPILHRKCFSTRKISMNINSEIDNEDNNQIDTTNTDTNTNNGNGNPLLNRWKSLEQETRDDIKATSASFIFAILLRLFIVEPRFIPSLSMFPTFDVGDQLLVDKVSNKLKRPYQRRDVVVFHPSETYVELTGNNDALIKRIVGVSGDTINVRDGKLFVNGVQQIESYINESPDYNLDDMKVPEGMLLVLGDNRNHSFDSHIWGFLPQENVIGRAVVKYWPLWRLGFVEGSV